MTLEREQLDRLIAVIEELAAGNLDARFPISEAHDDVDAIGFGVNTLAEELAETIAGLQREIAARRETESELEISERRQRRISEELQNLRTARLASLGVLAAGVGHEINNPLTYVMGNLELLAHRLDVLLPESSGSQSSGSAFSSVDAAELRELLRDSRDGTERIRRIVQDLGLFARNDDDSTETLLDLRQVMESALVLVGNQIRHRARLSRDYAAVPRIRASESRLAQIFVNLLVNAVHSLPSENVSGNEIRVAIGRADEGSVFAEVSDTGRGISREDLARVFDPFFTTKPRGEGTGLGLPICRELVSKLGGRIAVESEVGRGTTFRVELPIGVENDCAHDVAPPDPDPARELDHVPRVLIVDDDRSVALLLSRMLRDAESTIANGGREALEVLAASEDYDVVFCDIMMPDLSGVEVFEAVRSRAPHLAERFVFVTGGAFTESARRFLASVPNQRLTKPVEFGELNRVVRERAARARREP